MKSIQVLFLLVLLSMPASLFAKSGPPITVPGISICEAVKLASDYFYNKEERIADGGYFRKSDYILISAQYTNLFKEEYEQEMAWKIKFVHPVQNDHSVVYKVTAGGQVVFIYASR